MKRYVMTKDKTIYDTTKMPTIDFSLNADVDKTSDNLLDLAEIGDMVEIVDEQGLDYIHLTENFPASKVNELTLDFEIVAIWKRNGDVMRRYRVE